MDMYDGKVQVGQKVVIVGGGLAGTEAALELAMQGKQVTLVEMALTWPATPTPSTSPP